ncbi:MAG: HAMP domain-containing histidine kinase [Alphaproteobacteria bacterium]|nr:HAMP domain-containing histidine kinase [Alphaproteobacteria bacterium]
MPTVIRFDRDLAPGANPTALFDQYPEPIAYFDSDNRLAACNLSFRSTFPVIIESEFLKRAGAVQNASQICASTSPRYAVLQKDEACKNVAICLPELDISRNLQPEVRRTSDGGTWITLRDMSPWRDLEDEYCRRIRTLNAELAAAQKARQEAIDTARARKDFLTTTSHELRTPLNAILGFSEMISLQVLGPLQNERYLEYAQIIHGSGTHLLSLVNDLLDLSKLEAGKMELHFEPIQILKVILDCVRFVETQAATAHVGISVHVYDGVNLLSGDDKRLHQMLLNLLSNALKFTPVGGEVTIGVFRRGTDIAISVSDTGIGIKTEDIPKVLERFGQIESDLGKRHQGTGLGLPLTKELAELHGGSLTMESNMEVGTTVTIMLPPDPQAAMHLTAMRARKN